MSYEYKTTPYQHQRDVLNQSWKRTYFGLLMEMGTGKTKVIIDNVAALHAAGECTHVLILAPKSVAHNWIDELQLHMPDRVKYSAEVWSAGMGKKRTAELESLMRYSHLRIVIMNTEGIWTNNAFDYAERFAPGSFMVVDESIMLKNNRAKRTKAAKKLGQLAKWRRILTGQPVPQGPLDLYGQCEFLQPGCLGYPTYTSFKAAYAITRQVDLGGRKKFEQILGYKNIQDLRSRLAPFVKIISKEECLDLPPKIYKRMEITLSPEQHKAYTEMKEMSMSELSDGTLCTAQEIMTRLIRLHQITCGYLPDDEGKLHPLKNHRMDVLMDEYLPNIDGPCIIWSHFTHSVQMISDALVGRYGSEAVTQFRGATKQADRQLIVKRFQNKKEPLRFIVANKTMAYGVTLTACTNMLYYTNQWSLDVRQQSEDRAHRSGLRHPVLYTDFVCPGTIDEQILKALHAKQQVAQQVLAAPKHVM